MTAAMDLYSETFPPHGGIDGRAVTRVLGKTAMQVPEVLLREAVQNSWDARLQPQGPITFTVTGRRLTPSQHQVLAEQVLARLPQGGYDTSAHSEEPRVLVLGDSGTTGLDGTTRADLAGQRSRFVDFVRNVGRSRDKGYGGGTYGFGKGVLFEASRSHTIVVYTRIASGATTQSRLIGIGLGDNYSQGGRPYTGRHWWGRIIDGVLEPLTGEPADETARALGLNQEGTGTTVMIVAPRIAEPAADDPIAEDLTDLVTQMADAATLWIWPHMLGPSPTIRFSFAADGEPISVQRPEEHPRLRHFARAYEQIEKFRAGGPDLGPFFRPKDLMTRSPRTTVGHLAHDLYGPLQAQQGILGHEDINCHIALMRGPRFVVKYRRIAPSMSGKDRAGVFVAAAEHENLFAESENPTHDDWQSGAGRGGVNPVASALRLMTEDVKEAAQGAAEAGTGTAQGVAALAGRLGGLVDGTRGGRADGAAAEDRHGGGGGGGRGRKPRAIVNQHVDIRKEGAVTVARFSGQIRVPRPAPVRIRWTASVGLDGGTEEYGPLLGQPVTVLAWRLTPNPSGGTAVPIDGRGDAAESELEVDTDFWVDVLQPEDCLIKFKATAETADPK